MHATSRVSFEGLTNIRHPKSCPVSQWDPKTPNPKCMPLLEGALRNHQTSVTQNLVPFVNGILFKTPNKSNSEESMIFLSTPTAEKHGSM